MPLSINTPLVRTDIDTIISLKAHKVFLLNGFANDKVVIKGDPTPVSHVKTTSSIMKMVSPGAKMKLLTQQERNELIKFVEFFKGLKAFYHQTGVQAPELEDDRPIRQLDVHLRDQDINSMKMDHHQLTDIESAFEARSMGDNSPLKAIKRGPENPWRPRTPRRNHRRGYVHREPRPFCALDDPGRVWLRRANDHFESGHEPRQRVPRPDSAQHV